MAHRAMFDGGEIPAATTCGAECVYLYDAFRARSGTGYVKFKRTTAATRPAGWTLIANSQGASGLGAVADQVATGATGRGVGRVFFRPITAPSADLALWGCDFTSPWSAAVVWTPSGKLVCTISNGTTWPSAVSAGTESTLTVAVRPAGPDWDYWYRLDVTVDVTNGSGSTDTITLSCTITTPGGATETITHSSAASSKWTTGSTLTSVFLRQPGPYVNAGNVTAELDLDDMFSRCASGADVALAVLPAEDRVMLVLPSGPGALQQWTGTWTRAARVICFGATEPRYQEATTAGLDTTFVHPTAAQLAAGITSIGGVQLHPIVRAGSVITASLIYAGAVVAPNINGAGTNPWDTSPEGVVDGVYNAIAPLPLATFDTMTWGVRSTHASSTRLYGYPALVLYSGLPRRAEITAPVGSGYHQTFVRWTGDGSEWREINVGWAPHLILHFPLTASTVLAGWWTADRPGNLVHGWLGTMSVASLATIMGQTASGFIAGATLNVSGAEYLALCLRDDGNAADGRVLTWGESFNRGTLTESVVGETAWQPEVLFAQARTTGNVYAYLRTASMTGADSALLNLDDFLKTTAITGFTSTGFTLGNHSDVTDRPVSWWALRRTAAVNTAMAFTYGQQAASIPDVVITPWAGGHPYAVLGRMHGSYQARKRFAIPSIFTGANCQQWENGSLNGTGAIIALDQAAGTFTLKGDSPGTVINGSNGGYWIAFTEATDIAPTPTAVDDAYTTPFQTSLTVAAGVGVLANDLTNGGPPLTAVLVTGPTHGTLTLYSDGGFSYVPAADFSGLDSFTYRASSSSPATVTLTVLPGQTGTFTIPGYEVSLDCPQWGYTVGRQFGTRNEGVTDYGVLHREVTGRVQRTATVRFTQIDSKLEALRTLAIKAGRNALTVTFIDPHGEVWLVDWPDANEFQQMLENRREFEVTLLQQAGLPGA